jgi:hypothetical protein
MKQTLQRLKEFLMSHAPNVVVVNTSAEGHSRRIGSTLYSKRRGGMDGEPDIEVVSHLYRTILHNVLIRAVAAKGFKCAASRKHNVLQVAYCAIHT